MAWPTSPADLGEHGLLGRIRTLAAPRKHDENGAWTVADGRSMPAVSSVIRVMSVGSRVKIAFKDTFTPHRSAGS